MKAEVKAEGRRQKAEGLAGRLLPSALCLLVLACVRTVPVAPPPATIPLPPPPPPPTLEEVRALRTDPVAYEQGLRALPNDRRALALPGLRPPG